MQASSGSVNGGPDARELMSISLHSDDSLDDGRHANRRHDNAACPSNGRDGHVIESRPLLDVVHELPGVTACPQETRCKLLLSR